MADTGLFRLIIPRAMFEAILEQARQELPNECCGFLAGRVEDGIGKVVKRYPLVNAAASPIAFDAEPSGLFAAHKDMRNLGVDVLAIYHSHPTSHAVPSKTDLAKNLWGNAVVWLIVSFAGAAPVVRGWWLEETTFREAEVEIEH